MGPQKRAGISRVMIRPTGRVRSFKPSCCRVGPGQEVVRNLTGRNGSGQDVFESHGSGRITLTRSDPREVARPVKGPGKKLKAVRPHRRLSMRGNQTKPHQAKPNQTTPCAPTLTTSGVLERGYEGTTG